MFSNHIKTGCKSSITQDEKEQEVKDKNQNTFQGQSLGKTKSQDRCESLNAIALKSEGIPFASVSRSELAEARKSIVANAAEKNIRECSKSMRTEMNIAAYELLHSNPEKDENENTEDCDPDPSQKCEKTTDRKEKEDISFDSLEKRNRKKLRNQEKDQWSVCLNPKAKKNESEENSKGTVKHFLETSDWKSSENPSTLDNVMKNDSLKNDGSKGLGSEKEGFGSFTGWLKALGRKAKQKNVNLADSKNILDKEKNDHFIQSNEWTGAVKSNNIKEESTSKIKLTTTTLEENHSENINRSFSNSTEKNASSEKMFFDHFKSSNEETNSKNMKNSENSLFAGVATSNSNPSFDPKPNTEPNTLVESETEPVTDSLTNSASIPTAFTSLNFSLLNSSSFSSPAATFTASKETFSVFPSLFASNCRSSQAMDPSSVKINLHELEHSARENVNSTDDVIMSMNYPSTSNSHLMNSESLHVVVIEEAEGKGEATEREGEREGEGSEGEAIRNERDTVLIDTFDNYDTTANIISINVPAENIPVENVHNSNVEESMQVPVETSVPESEHTGITRQRAPNPRAMLDVIVPVEHMGSGDTEVNIMEGNFTSGYSEQVSVHNEIQVVPFGHSLKSSRKLSHNQSSDSQGYQSDEANPFLVLEAVHRGRRFRYGPNVRLQHWDHSRSCDLPLSHPTVENRENFESQMDQSKWNESRFVTGSAETDNANAVKNEEVGFENKESIVDSKVKSSDLLNLPEKMVDKMEEPEHEKRTGKIERVRERWIGRFKGNNTKTSLPLSMVDEFERIEKNDFTNPLSFEPSPFPDESKKTESKGEENDRADEAIYHFFNEMEKLGGNECNDNHLPKTDFNLYNSFSNSKMCTDNEFKINEYHRFLNAVGEIDKKDFNIPLSSLLSSFQRNEKGEMVIPFDFSHPNNQKLKVMRKWRLDASEAWSNLLTSENIDLPFSSSLPGLPPCKLTLSSKDSVSKVCPFPTILQCCFCGLKGHDFMMCSETIDCELPLLKSRVQLLKSYKIEKERASKLADVESDVDASSLDKKDGNLMKHQDSRNQNQNQNQNHSEFMTRKLPSASPSSPSPSPLCLPSLPSSEGTFCLRCLEEGHWGSECFLSVTEASAMAKEKERKMERKSKEKIVVLDDPNPYPLFPSVNINSPSLPPFLPRTYSSTSLDPYSLHPLLPSSPLPLPSREVQNLFEEIGEKNSHCSSAMRQIEMLSMEGEGEEGGEEVEAKEEILKVIDESQNVKIMENEKEIEKDMKMKFQHLNDGGKRRREGDGKGRKDYAVFDQRKRKERTKEEYGERNDAIHNSYGVKHFHPINQKNSLVMDEYDVNEVEKMIDFLKKDDEKMKSKQDVNEESNRNNTHHNDNDDNNLYTNNNNIYFNGILCNIDQEIDANTHDTTNYYNNNNIEAIRKRKRDVVDSFQNEEKIEKEKEKEKINLDLNRPFKKLTSKMENVQPFPKNATMDSTWGEIDFRVPCVTFTKNTSSSPFDSSKRIIQKTELIDLNVTVKTSMDASSSLPPFSSSSLPPFSSSPLPPFSSSSLPPFSSSSLPPFSSSSLPPFSSSPLPPFSSSSLLPFSSSSSSLPPFSSSLPNRSSSLLSPSFSTSFAPYSSISSSTPALILPSSASVFSKSLTLSLSAPLSLPKSPPFSPSIDSIRVFNSSPLTLPSDSLSFGSSPSSSMLSLSANLHSSISPNLTNTLYPHVQTSLPPSTYPMHSKNQKSQIQSQSQKLLPISVASTDNPNAKSFPSPAVDELNDGEKEDKTINKKSYNEKKFNEKKYNEKTYSDKTYNDKTYNDKTESKSIHPSSLFFSTKNIPLSLLQTFESIRLTRKEISKCLQHSDFESKVNGLFLRLKFGKQPNSLEFSGYKMAKICGTETKYLANKNTVIVTVEFAKIKYSVESQYISNKPFTKDEVLIWWDLNPIEDKEFLFSKKEMQELAMRKKELAI